MSNRVQILSTRPVGSELVGKASAYDIEIDEMSFIRIEPIIDKILKDKINNLLTQSITVVFTSSNAVKEVADYVSGSTPTSWSIYCIGNATQRLVAKSFGEKSIRGTAIDASQLAQIIIKDPVAHIVFFCGDHRRDELPGLLSSHGIEVEEVVVYKTILTPSAVLKKYDGILFFSPTAVESFFSMNTVSDETSLFVLGETTAGAIKRFIQTKVIVADKASKEDMIQQLIEHFREPTNKLCNS